ncbi:maleylpyruvate isomerase family mycothiol-dependent enzyme [Ornithinimicrobium faecis]|uniref:maleylpyruvate isomerase family mycothiol-dependent enzyme n=1 Tax=Ornithinimicrobium faecis TaxID=2934158 RepID=UPI00211918E1|nr:maleylpyruvate isomerase family mycothiol-dependent enzyme [Ornithinimicrobium sp. HY1745]
MSTAPAGTLPELALLERAIGYTRVALVAALDVPGDAPTPCAGWTLEDLLTHMNASLLTLDQAAQVGGIALFDPPGCSRGGLGVHEQVQLLSARACALLDSWTGREAPEMFRVGGSELQAGLLASAGALEITLHGWDVGQACGSNHPVPAALAEDLLSYAPLLISDADRPHRFGPALPTGADATADVELLALVGRGERIPRA